MATSNSTNFSMTANEIVSDALRLIDVLGVGETLSGDDYTLAVRQLNMMVKTWQAQGLHMWTETEGIVFVGADQKSYQLGGTSPDEASEEEIKTELSTAEAAASTVLGVDSTTGMAAADKIGIVLDDGSIDWTTIVSVDSATQVTITTGLTSAASIDNHVYAYTSDLTKPLDISSVRIENEGATDTELRKLARDDYFALSNKSAEGVSHSYYYDRQRDNGKLYIYPVPDDAVYRLRITFSRQIEDFDASTNNPDLPTEWLETLVWNLGVRLSPFFGRENKGSLISSQASALLQGLKGYDTEHTSYKIR